MSKETDFVRSEILAKFSDQRSDVGHALGKRVFVQMMMNWNPKQKDALELAVDKLVSDGLIEDKTNGLMLTQEGVDYIYPPVGSFVRDAILLNFSDSGAKVGHELNAKPLVLKSQRWNPKQNKSLEPVLEELCIEGLIEKQGDHYLLTQVGYDAIY